jgi:hypothetical protein
MSISRGLLGILLLSALALPVQAQSTLGMIERFGPDGLPFTQDDPLAVGAHSSSVRFGAVGGDACSEEPGALPGDVRGAHGTGGLHPPVVETDTLDLTGARNHRSRPSPTDYDNGVSSFVLDAPFDATFWILGMNLDDGRMARFRVFPTQTPDPDVWITGKDEPASGRGWVDGWGSEDVNMGNVVSGPVKNLHLEPLGLAYRDAKSRYGFATSIKYPTIGSFPQFYDKIKDKMDRVDLYAQESYVEAWVTEMQNLDTSETGISGRFVLDLAGLQINTHQKKFKHSQTPCDAKLDAYYLDLGGPVNTVATTYSSVVDYFVGAKWDAIWSHVDLDGPFGVSCNFLKPIAEPIAKDLMKDKLQALDDLADFVDLSEYTIIGDYSGLAGRDEKNPFDRVALGALKQFGQFRAAEWQHWQHVDASELLIGFEPPTDLASSLTSSMQALTDQIGWRYNSGSSYLGKSMMLLGNSGGTDYNHEVTRLGADDTQDGAGRKSAADLLRTFAMQWLYVRLDIVDPYTVPKGLQAAEWVEADMLIPQDINPPMRVDWPPPNYSFGTAQISSFRGASGGQPIWAPDSEAEFGEVRSVDASTSLIWKGLISIDPVGRTYSVSGQLDNGGPGPIWSFGEGEGPPWGPISDLTWSKPRSLGDSFPTELENTSSRRWLTAAANQWRNEEDVTLRWGWDFDSEDSAGALDSLHAQHMSDVGGATWGAVFAYQVEGKGLDGIKDKGRTGFRMVDQTVDF